MNDDPKNLIREAYRIEGISDAECRSIFMDWALSLPEGADSAAHMASLLARFGRDAPDHPMSVLLREGQGQMAVPGGRRGRIRRTS